MSNKRATRSNTSISYEEHQQNIKRRLLDHDVVSYNNLEEDDNVIEEEEEEEEEEDDDDDEYDDVLTDDEDEEDVAILLRDSKFKLQSLQMKKYKNVGNNTRRKFYMVKFHSYTTDEVLIKDGYTEQSLYDYIKKSLIYNYNTDYIELLAYCYIENERLERAFHDMGKHRKHRANYKTRRVEKHNEVYNYNDTIIQNYYDYIFKNELKTI